MATRERIHQLIDELPESDLDDVIRFLEDRRLPDALSRALAAASPDDESESPEEAAAMQQAYADIAEGRVVPHEEMLRRLSAPA
jgi:hypothetical protein